MVYMYGLEKNIETSCLDEKYRAVLPRSKGEIQRRLEENISPVLLTAREEFQSSPCYHLEQSYRALLSRSAGEFQSRPATAWKRVLEPSCSGRRQTLEPSFSCSGEELQSRLAKVLRRILQYRAILYRSGEELQQLLALVWKRILELFYRFLELNFIEPTCRGIKKPF